MLITSIFIYLLFAAAMCFLADNAGKSELLGQRKNANLSLLIAIVLFSLLSGLRYRVGVDCEEYASAYQLLLDGMSISNSDSLSKAEIGFLAISQFMAALHLPRFIYMGFWAFLEIGFLTLAMKSRKHILPFIFLTLILGQYYLSLMNGVRQSVVACAFVFAVQGLTDHKDWIKYLIVVILSCLIHKSAILLLPFILVVYYNRSPKVLLCLILLVACAFIGHMPFVKDYAQLLKSLLSVSGYTNYADNLEYYTELEASITSFGPRQIVLLLSNIIVILFAGQVDKRNNKDKFYRVSFLFFMVYACLSELVVSMDIIFTRPLLYFIPFVLICQGYTLYYLFHPVTIVDFKLFRIKNNSMLATVAFCCVSVLFCSYCILNNIAEQNIIEETTLFKFYFLR